MSKKPTTRRIIVNAPPMTHQAAKSAAADNKEFINDLAVRAIEQLPEVALRLAALMKAKATVVKHPAAKGRKGL